ncbi:MAG: hypothetical protein JNJ69_01025 [Leptospiraceae bacterium]|nr:hypothetical protein [Leptospiraceae bacterium]
MKKLISVFAALALVGSLAAQKGKKPAKAPAKPAVAAPAVPAAVTTAAAIAPSAKGAAKGVGLFIDLRGSYTFANGTSTAGLDGQTGTQAETANTATDATARTYKTSASQGFGGGVSIGYDIVEGLGLVASYDIRSIKTREFKSGSFVGAGATADTTSQQKWTNQIIGVGLRPHVNALGGEWFAGAGLAIVLPFETTTTTTVTNATTAYNTGTGTFSAREDVKGYNMAFGAYGELGYKFMFTDMIGLNIGIRAIVATADNNGKTLVRKNTVATASNSDNFATTVTTTYKDSFSSNDVTNEEAANSATARKHIAQFETLGITDFSANVGISLKF